MDYPRMTQQRNPELYVDSWDQYQQQRSWDRYQQQRYETHRTQSFNQTQIPSHITVHNHWNYAQEQRSLHMPQPTARHFKYANPHWKNQKQVFRHTQNNYGRDTYPGSRHHNHERQRPFVSRLNETGKGPKGPSGVYNPSRFRYVSENYLRSLKENNITCSQTSQPRNVQVAVIKPIARVESLEEGEKVSSCELDSDASEEKSKANACKTNELYSTENDYKILENLDYKVVPSDIHCTNEANEKQNETNQNSNFIDIKPNVSALSNRVEPLLEEQKDNTDKTKAAVCGESKTTILPPVISDLFLKHSLEKCTIETESCSKHKNVDSTYNDSYNSSDLSLISSSNFDNLTQYNENTIDKVKPLTNTVEYDLTVHKYKEKIKSKIDPKTSILTEVPEPRKFISPIECRSPIQTTQEENNIKNIKETNVTEHLTEFNPFGPSKNSEFHITQKIDETSLPEIPLKILEKSTCNENLQTKNSDVLTPEMLRERLFRRFINSNELIMPVENKIQGQNFISQDKKIESLVSNTLKIAGINPTDIEISTKNDKKHISIKTEDGSHLFTNEFRENLCLQARNNLESSPDTKSNKFSRNTAEDEFSFPKPLKDIPKIEKNTDSLNSKLQLDLFDGNLLKILSNVNLFSNLDILFLKDILAKIKTSTSPINDKIENTNSNLKIENACLQNISVTNNPKVDCVNGGNKIKFECLKNELNLCPKMISPKKEKTDSPLDEEIDTSLMLNLESVEECMINSVPVVHLQSEIWEENKFDKEDTNRMESVKKCEESHATEIHFSRKFETTNDDNNLSGIKPQTTYEKNLDTFKNPVCTLKESCMDEGSLILADVKVVPLSNSSLNASSSNNENLSNIDIDLSTIEHNLDKMFGMDEEENLNETVELLDKDMQSTTTVDTPKQMEHDSESYISDHKNNLEIADKSSNNVKRYFIEYSPSMKVTDDNDAMSISSDEVGDGDDCFPGEENYDFQQQNGESKLVDNQNEDADNDLEKNSEINSSLDEKKNGNKDNGIDNTSNVENYKKYNYESNSDNKTDLFGPYNKYSGVEKSQIKFCKSNELGMAFEADDDLPDLNKANFGKSLLNKTGKNNNEFYLGGKEVSTKSAIESCNSEVTKSLIINLQKKTIVNSSLKRSTSKSGSKRCGNKNNDKFTHNVKFHKDHTNSNKITKKCKAKLKRLFDSDFTEDAPNKKVTVKKRKLKCKPKDRKININKVSTCLSPKSLSKALKTSSYIIEDKVADICPLGHSLERCYSTVNVNTDRISVFCQICKKIILMGENS